MRRWLDSLEEFAIKAILHNEPGVRATLLRWFLSLFSGLFGGLVQLRLALYERRIFRERQLGVIVISIGNLTVGGTGKTPVVELFARTLAAGGRRVAILSRGYKSRRPPLWRRLLARVRSGRAIFAPRVVSDGKSVLLGSEEAGDEPYMLAKNLPGTVVVVDKDRVKAGLYAIEKLKADVLLLDDGYQYIRLQQRLDVVLVDRQQPFGNERLLPRGTLREPPRNLHRARYIFITKSLTGGNVELIERIRQYNRTAEIIECEHRPLYLENLLTGERLPLEYLKGRFIGALSGIAVPESFEGALKALGADVTIWRHYADHHRYTDKEILTFVHRAIQRDLHAIITTEKDAVRIPRLPNLEIPILFLRVEIAILSGHESWQNCIRRLCEPSPLLVPERIFE